MNINEINGQRQYDFVSRFNYVREAGRPAELQTAKAIQEELKSFGVESSLEAFPFTAYEVEEARLIVTEPYQKEYTVTGYGFSGSTPEEGLTLPLCYVENGDEISLSQANGKLVLINGPVRADLYQKLVEAGAAGFVGITGGPLDEGIDRVPGSICLRAVENPSIQGVSIHYLDAVELVTRGASRATFILRQKNAELTSHNVIARIDGSDKKDEVLTLTAHYDSVPAGPGAYDNMAACAIILELCRFFKKNPPRRSMEFIWFGAEEKGLLGSLHYVTSHDLSNHQFNMNVDLAGQLVGGTVIGVTGDASICGHLETLAREIGLGMTTQNKIWGSDSNSFAWKGVPALTLNRDGFGMHTRHDTIDWISPWSLQRSAALLGHIAEWMGTIDVLPFPRTIPESFMTDLDRYFHAVK
jgi:aminopeptidase YwaD